MDVSTWLRDLGLENYVQAFEAHDIDAEVLPRLTADDLTAIGITSVGHRRRLLDAIASLQGSGAPASAQQTAVTTRPSQAERRQLTVLFVDLVGSTALAARLDPEDMGQVIRTYHGTCTQVVERWGGHVAKYMGDGVLAYFGWPQAHEDEAERAVRAGLALTEAVGNVVVQGGAPLAARVGIATGLVMVGELIGEGAAKEQTVVGETPNLAARLQALAPPGSVVISQATRRLVGGLFELTDLGPRRIKGFAEPLTAFRVEGEGRAEGRFEALHGEHLTPLVGREHELGILLERWAWARDGDGQVVLLAGEPGIGKSRMLRALREHLSDEQYTPLSHYCSPHHTNSALHPVIDLLERATRLDRAAPADAQLATLEMVLSRSNDRLDEVVPLLAALLGVPTGQRYPALALTPEVQKRRTLQALLDQLGALASQQPVLALYEDVHWIDPSTLELLGMVIERVRQLRVLALITFRPEFQPPWVGHAHVTALTMSRLGRRQGADLVVRVTGDKPLPDEVVEQIVGRTDGVPLFVEELTKAVLESGLLRDAGDHYELLGPLPPLAIPATLHDSLLARLDRLAPVKEVAQVGAVIGREFSHELLAAVADSSEAQLQAALDQLVAAELVFRRGTPPEAIYTFKHALVQDAAYGTLLKSKRQQLHARIAQVLEEQFPETAQTQPELLAHHCTQAGLVVKAIEYWNRGGELAIRRSTMAEAVALLDNGLDALQGLPESEERDRQELELQVALGVALVAARGMPAPETGRAYTRARDLAQRLGETQALFRALYGLNSHYGSRADVPSASEAAATLLSLAYDQEDAAAQTVGHRCVGVIAIWSGEFPSACAELERTLGLYDPVQHRDLAFAYGQDPWAGARAWLAWPLLLTGHPKQALIHHRESVAHAREMNHPNTLAQTLYCGCVIRQLIGDRRGVLKMAEALIPLAEEQGFPYWLAMATILRGWALSKAGETERGVAEVARGLTAFRATAAQLWMPYFLSLLAEAQGKAGEQAEGLCVLSEALDRVAQTGERWFEAELHRRKGELLLSRAHADEDAAEAAFHRSIAVAREQSAKMWELRAATSLARLWSERGERQKAHDLLAPVYGWFTEGFDTADLKDAKALLDELA